LKLSEIKQVLSEQDLKLSKSLGQNFLHDQNQIRRIVSAARLTCRDRVLEIGPGLGPLTELLVPEAGEVLAIEKDRRLFHFLEQKFAGAANLKLIHADALDYLKTHREWADWKLVANLPYSVASPILVELAEANGPPEQIVATLQLEVAERLNATTGDEHYGLLSLLMQLRYQPHGWLRIPASCFFPEPDVDSACVEMVRRSEPLLETRLHPLFTAIVKRSFSQRRKMMLKLLKNDWPQQWLAKAFKKLQLSEQIRAEKVGLEQFAQITAMLSAEKLRAK
jgi:16S rRNA (adenine1518-N6/adenine1519-N6)-dimethyltransferase